MGYKLMCKIGHGKLTYNNIMILKKNIKNHKI